MVFLGGSGVIGTQNEHSLHASLKEYFGQLGGIVEGSVDGFVIDVVQENRLVEIQTKNFSSIKKKLGQLLQEHRVHLVHPIAAKKQLVTIDPKTGEILSIRKSPKKGKIYDVFSELIRIPHLITNPNLTIEVLLVVEQEIRCQDGKGSWRRRGISIIDRRLAEIIASHVLGSVSDYIGLLPKGLEKKFTNKELAKELGLPVTTARKINYTLKKAGIITEVGKTGNEIIHEIA